ncbi:hypothetical protein [Rhodopila sp.]|jgi:hypothetical protein|uniref:hypothetical protein n=1 Tax=Rhodopila sp. TaxID=2480087 RepID=UPI002CDA5D29|nr:hypothetical protein [Rhodopila sp.]HVZ08518.1 hypothetical protein [Rhodopila sp.]
MKTAPPAAPSASAADMRLLRQALTHVDDDKLRRIAAVVDSTADPAVNMAVLEPLRARLGPLHPPRLLRLPRLLFLPFDPIMVEAKAWRAEEPLVPRSAVMPVTDLVRTALGTDAAEIEALIAGRDTADVEVVAQAGGMLWPKAAAVAASASTPPPAWAESGLPGAAFQPLLLGMATVWRRAVRLRVLARDRLLDAMKASQKMVEELLADTPAESPLGCAMIARLILLQAPSAAPFVRLFANAATNRADQAILHKALVQSVTCVAASLDQTDAFWERIGKAPLEDAGDVARGLVSLLTQLEEDPGGHVPPPRLLAMRDGLNRACLARFADGLNNGVTAPLQQASEPLSAASQGALEDTARDLRMLETAARPLGGGGEYDALLEAATRAVHDGGVRGTLSRMGEIRLTEILAGPEAALSLYRAGAS